VSDIGVCMRPEVLRHKQRDGRKSDGKYCFWTMARTPDEVERGSKLWVASGGRWVGFFLVDAVIRDIEIRFHSETWFDRDGGPRSPFQGYTFHVPEAKA
jgi:hypothetical protein